MRVKKIPLIFSGIIPKRFGIFSPNFTCLLQVPINARLEIFIQLPATLTKLCHIKRNQLVYTVYLKCSPSAEMHAGIFPKQLGIFGPNFTHLFHVPVYTRLQIFTQLSPAVICSMQTSRQGSSESSKCRSAEALCWPVVHVWMLSTHLPT